MEKVTERCHPLTILLNVFALGSMQQLEINGQVGIFQQRIVNNLKKNQKKSFFTCFSEGRTLPFFDCDLYHLWSEDHTLKGLFYSLKVELDTMKFLLFST